MKIDPLRLFVRVAATNEISKAGQQLRLSTAVASSYMARLEEELGVRLVHRTSRKVSLTEEGHAFLPYAENVLASVEQAVAAVGTRPSHANRRSAHDSSCIIWLYALGAGIKRGFRTFSVVPRIEPVQVARNM